MATIIEMPKLGLTMEEGTIERWIKQEGDAVKEGDEICEFSTDKLSNVVTAPSDGILLKILVQEGDSAECQTGIAVIGEDGEDITSLF